MLMKNANQKQLNCKYKYMRNKQRFVRKNNNYQKFNRT